MPHKPTFPDSDKALKAAPDFAARYQLLAGGHFPRTVWEDAAEAALNACR